MTVPTICEDVGPGKAQEHLDSPIARSMRDFDSSCKGMYLMQLVNRAVRFELQMVDARFLFRGVSDELGCNVEALFNSRGLHSQIVARKNDNDHAETMAIMAHDAMLKILPTNILL